ncbi:tyrosine-protein phosphatase [Deinococcus sonorensis]|uniref:Tyrosine-protein phosphatase n=2 Tax=Deinococcus sonorensis TaxID=309891 RepID=A0AAU7UB57_9DEIO
MSEPVTWDGALNTRQPLPGLIRSANLSFLSERGRAQLLGSGVSRIIDLRNRGERQIDPAPFAGQALYLNLPLIPARNPVLEALNRSARSNAEYDRGLLDQAGTPLAAVFGAMVDAPEGPVLIHCHAGKDRTGLVSALALDLCGVPRPEIAADYAESDRQLTHFYAAQQSREPDPARRARLATFQVSRAGDMLGLLEHLDRRWGGVAAYLTDVGFGRLEQATVVRRLLAVS